MDKYFKTIIGIEISPVPNSSLRFFPVFSLKEDQHRPFFTGNYSKEDWRWPFFTGNHSKEDWRWPFFTGNHSKEG